MKRYPLYLSVFGNLHEDILKEENQDQLEQESVFIQGFTTSEKEEEEDNEMSSNEDVPQERVEPGGFLVTPMDIDDNPFDYEEGFDYTYIDMDDFISIFKQMRDANANVIIPDEYEGFTYSFIEKFGDVEPVKQVHFNKLRGRGGNNQRGRGGFNSRGRGGNNQRGRGGNIPRGRGRGR